MAQRTTISTRASEALYERASTLIPGGVNSPVRAMRSVGRTHPLFLHRGDRSYVWDADGNRYVDWMMSWGALPLGHADPDVVEAAEAALRGGSSFGAPTAREVELAELVCEAVESVERVRFVSSGTEATMSAVRVARAATGRDTIVTFAGCYHGHSDAFLASGGSGLATLSIPSSPGVPTAVAEQTIVSRYNDLAHTEQLIAESGRQIAAIIVEPVAANMGVVAPKDGFLDGLRALCDRIGAVLIFDEVITGFRLALGGAQEVYGVRPDLSTFGKVIGGGLPVGAFGGRADLMDEVAPAGSVYQAGTLSGNPLAMAAGIATLTKLEQRDAFSLLDERGHQLYDALRSELEGVGDVDVSRVGSLVTLFHLDPAQSGAPTNFDEAGALDTQRFAATHAALLAEGNLLPPSQYEAWFVSTAHTPEQIEELAAAVGRHLRGEG